MKLEGDYLFEANVAEVWSALFDPVILAAVMPGCEKLELVDGHYVGDIKVKVGPIQGKFTGKVDLKDKIEPRSYTMIIDGRGAPGFVKATAQVKLAAEGEATRVHYDTDAQVGGKIASVGQRLLEASARAIVAQSLEGLHTNIKLRAAAYRDAAAKQAAPAEATAAPAEATAAPAEATAAPAATVEPAPAAATVPADPPAFEAPTKSAELAAISAGAVATAAEATSAEGAWSGEPTVKTGPPTSDPAESIGEATVKTVSPIYIEVATGEAASGAVRSTQQVASAAAKATAAPAEPPIAFTPVKVKQSALANAVAKEVASTLFPRSVLVAIILIQALVIVWLLVRH